MNDKNGAMEIRMALVFACALLIRLITISFMPDGDI